MLDRAPFKHSTLRLELLDRACLAYLAHAKGYSFLNTQALMYFSFCTLHLKCILEISQILILFVFYFDFFFFSLSLKLGFTWLLKKLQLHKINNYSFLPLHLYPHSKPFNLSFRKNRPCTKNYDA